MGSQSGIEILTYLSQTDMEGALQKLLPPGARVAIEYSPRGELPVISFVDAGTFEMLRGLQLAIVSSGSVLQYGIARWSDNDLQSHLRAARKLARIIQDGFVFIGHRHPSEYEVGLFIQRCVQQEGLAGDGGVTVCVNSHTRLPHHTADPLDEYRISPGDWVLIDLWARENDGPFADITWMGYFGSKVPGHYAERFELVANTRDLVIEFLERSHTAGVHLLGWQVDQVARDYLNASAYGQYFSHRLGHSLGRSVHGYGVNLDGYETLDTRPLIPGIGFTVEPGIYPPDFGVRTEVDIFWSQSGPMVTTPIQKEVVLIGD
jgi:Xaa-Pro aminopeptidase